MININRTAKAAALAALLVMAACGNGGDGGGGERGGMSSALSAADAAGTAAEGLRVTGVGRANGAPDVVTATLGAEGRRDSVQAALDESSAAARAMTDALRAEGVAAADIQTSALSVRPPHEERPVPGRPPASGESYVATNLVTVNIRDVDRAGAVLQAAAAAGGDATRIRGVHWAIEGDDELVRAAREAAVAEARDKAEHYAELAGVQLGDLVHLAEHQGPTPLPADAGAALAVEAGSVPVEPGHQEVTIIVTAVWEIR